MGVLPNLWKLKLFSWLMDMGIYDSTYNIKASSFPRILYYYLVFEYVIFYAENL